MKQSASVSDTREFAPPAQQQWKRKREKGNQAGDTYTGNWLIAFVSYFYLFALLSENKDATA